MALPRDPATTAAALIYTAAGRSLVVRHSLAKPVIIRSRSSATSKSLDDDDEFLSAVHRRVNLCRGAEARLEQGRGRAGSAPQPSAVNITRQRRGLSAGVDDDHVVTVSRNLLTHE